MVRPARPHARALAAASVWALAALAGCASHRGEWSRRAAAPSVEPSGPALRLILIGDAAAKGRHGPAIAARIAARIKDGEADGVASALIWLGDNNTSRSCEAASFTGVQAFVDLADRHIARTGAASVSTLGEIDWRCGLAQAGSATTTYRPSTAGSAAPGPSEPAGQAYAHTHGDSDRSTQMNYVVRLRPDGTGRVVSKCSGVPATCTIDMTTPGVLDLVVVDTAAWLDPPAKNTPAAAAAERSIVEQRALLSALRDAPQAQEQQPQRLLVTHHPIESAGPHGVGGLWPDSSFLFHDEALQRAIEAGLFAGVLSGHERSLQATADLTDGVKRSSRVWLEQPIFQVTSGASSRGDAGPGARSWPYYQGIALAPDHVSNHPGFAELTITDERFTIVLHARRHGRWEIAETTIPRQRPRHPTEQTSPGLEPCLSCDSRDPEERARDPR